MGRLILGFPVEGIHCVRPSQKSAGSLCSNARTRDRVCAPGGRIAIQDLTPAASKAPAFDAIEWIRDPSHRQTYTSDAFRAMGAALSLREVYVRTLSPDLPLEATLATSFPAPGALDRVRELYGRDAAQGAYTFGLRTRLIDDALWVTYPLTLIIWACP